MRLNKFFYTVSCSLGLFPLLKLNHFSILMMIWLVLAIANVLKKQSFSTLKTHKYKILILSFF